jgi:hypothetical protein
MLEREPPRVKASNSNIRAQVPKKHHLSHPPTNFLVFPNSKSCAKLSLLAANQKEIGEHNERSAI